MSSNVSSRQAILVLGMHRSGTSAFSGVLARLGVQPPKTLMKPAKDNPLGFWESSEIVAFHDRILESIGSVWSDWSKVDETLLQSVHASTHISALQDLILREFGENELFFAKDPRMCRFPAIWIRALGEMNIEAKVVIQIRHPGEVARSLEVRNGLGASTSRLIWLRHVLEAEFATRGVRRTFVLYPKLLVSWRKQMDQVAEELGVIWPISVDAAASSIEEFLQLDLRHHEEDLIDNKHNLVEEAYLILRDLAQGESTEALDRLDRIRRDFDSASSVFAPAFHEVSSTKTQVVASQVRSEGQPMLRATDIVANLEPKLAAFESRVTAEQRTHARELREEMLAGALSVRQQISELVQSMQSGAAQFAEQLAELVAELRLRGQIADDLRAALRARDDELSSLVRRIDQLRELHRQEAVKRQAVDTELHRTIADQNTALDANANKIRTMREEVSSLKASLSGLRSALAAQKDASQLAIDRLKSGHAADILALKRANAEQRQRAEALAGDLQLMQNSRGWKLLNLLRRAVGRSPVSIKSGLIGDIELIRESGMFDEAWYLQKHPDVRASGMDPIEHYLRFGASSLFDPSQEFSTQDYLNKYRDVKIAGLNPLLHHITLGVHEGRLLDNQSNSGSRLGDA